MSTAADSQPTGAGRKRARPRAEGAAPRGATAKGAIFEPAVAWPAFWLPAALRARLITADTRWHEVRFARGRECGPDFADDEAGAVAARWPLFGDAEWTELVSGLRTARQTAPRGPEYWRRLQIAMATVARRLADPADPCHQALLQALPGYTGYSAGMIAAAFGSAGAPGASDPWNLEQMVAALRYRPDKVCSARWRKVPGLPGRVRFFPSNPFDKVAGWLPVAWEMPLYAAEARPDMVLAYAAGNVPGTALTMLVRALSSTLRGEAPLPGPEPPPAVLVRNAIEEPLLTPLVLSAIEEVDPELVSMVAALVWDHGDDSLERRLLAEADLVVAAAGDEIIAGLSRRMGSLRQKPRFHAHGRKVSFSVISREVLDLQSVWDDQEWTPPESTEIIDIVALLAGLDSAYWDQNSCLSSRVHFVERGGPADELPAEYARRLTTRLRQIAEVMPRGAWPARKLHDPFDRYKAMEGSDRWGTGLRVMSDYDDPFVVVLDERNSKESRLDPSVFASMVNECQTRVIAVRPVDDIMEVPWRYLRMLPRESLQSLSVAVGRPGEGLSRQFLRFAGACGKQGVTSIKMVGSAAFPRPAYSWDGLLPLDLVGRRPAGYFTTVEFDSPFEEMMETYRAHLHRLAQIPLRPQEQHRSGAAAHHVLGDGAHQQVPDLAVTMRGHHDQIGA